MDEDNHGEAVFLSPTLVFSPFQSARRGGGHGEDGMDGCVRGRKDARRHEVVLFRHSQSSTVGRRVP